jgi:oxidoreductase
MTSAKLMKEAGINHFHLVTSMGSNANSWFLYPQTKGQVENECMQLGFNKLTIYRPGLLFTPRDEKRTFEAIVQAITPVKLGMPVETLGKLFVQHTVANLETPKFEKPEILENGQIWQLFEKYSKN